MKIAFFGTSDRSIPILNTLKSHTGVSLCVTKADTHVGRKQVIKETAVKRWAKENGVDYIEINDLKDQNQQLILNTLKQNQIELGIVADFSIIIPENIINNIPYGIINIHFSLLPLLRGASPVQHAILQNYEKTGITYFLLDKSMDTGPILHQIEYTMPQNETAGTLYQELFEIAAEHLPKVIEKYCANELKPQKQNDAQATYTYSKTHPHATYIYKEDAKIDWSRPPQTIERQVRAYHPWPIAWTTLKEITQAPLPYPAGYTINPNKNPELKVKIYEAQLENSQLHIKELQVEGSKTINWNDFINGYMVKI